MRPTIPWHLDLAKFLTFDSILIRILQSCSLGRHSLATNVYVLSSALFPSLSSCCKFSSPFGARLSLCPVKIELMTSLTRDKQNVLRPQFIWMTTVFPLISINLNGPSHFLVAHWYTSTRDPAGRSLNSLNDSSPFFLPFVSIRKRFFFELGLSQLLSLLLQWDVPSVIELLPVSSLLAVGQHRRKEVLDTCLRGQRCS